MSNNEFYKRKETDKVWWTHGNTGEWLFSFDKVKIYNMFRDYPNNMTEKEVQIFDSENPYWAEFFSDRKKVRGK